MNASTQQRIEFLQSYIRDSYKQLFQFDPQNIVGLKISKKITGKKVRHNYSIVFQVARKKDKKKLVKTNYIPEYLLVRFPDGKFKKIKTDVQQTGKTRFHMGICRKPKRNGKIEVGTLGIVLVDDFDWLGLTNYHVAAFDRMLAGDFFFEGSDKKISVDGRQAEFIEGIFSDELDIAYLRMEPDGDDPNIMSDGSRIAGFIQSPIRPGIIGRQVMVYAKSNRNGRSARIKNNSTVFDTGFEGMQIIDVLQIHPIVTRKGDSGGLVVIDGDLLLGIVIGGDDEFTYAIPYHKINAFKSLPIA
jgi:hypothetical protein